MSSAPMIPAALAPVVKSIRGLYTIADKATSVVTATQTAAGPDLTLSSGSPYMTPADFQTIYDSIVPGERLSAEHRGLWGARARTFRTSSTSSSSISPNYICSSSYATCVGGTEFADTASPSSYWGASNVTNPQSALLYIPEGGWRPPIFSSEFSFLVCGELVGWASRSKDMRAWSWQGIVLLVICASIEIGCGGGGGSQNTQTSNPSPTLTSISPNSANAGSAILTLTATGTGFVSGSTINWNGAELTTTYMSSVSLTAQVPASDLSAARTATVTVQSPSPGGGTSGGLTFTINTPANPVPAITGLSPASANAGSAAFTLTVTGTQFIANSQVLWNGAALATTFLSSTSLTAQVPATDLSAAGTASVTVENPTPGGGESGGLIFTINRPTTTLTVLNQEGSDLAWDASRQLLYVAVPSGAAVNGSTITVVDPMAGSIAGSQTLSTAASGLAISDDNQYLYAAVNGAADIERLKLPGLTSDIQWPLGSGGIPLAQNLAGEIQVQPGAPHTVAVAMGQYGSGYVAVFDDGVQRSAVAGSSIGNSLQWKADGSTLYAKYTESTVSGYFISVSDDALYTMPVTQNGVGTATQYDSTFRAEGVHLHLDPATGYVYSDWGEAVNSANGEPVGNFRWTRPSGTYFPGALSVADPSLKRFYTLLEVTEPDGTQAFQLQVFDMTNYQLLSTIVIPSAMGTPMNMLRWGQAGLAFVTGGTSGRVYVVDGGFVNPSGVVDTTVGTTLTPVPTLASMSPLTASVGSSALTLTVTGHDFTGQSTVYWNTSALQTTLVSSSEVTAQVPASDLAAVGSASITVTNNDASFPASNAFTFAVNDAPAAGNQLAVYNTGGEDLAWDATAGKLYVSMPGVQGDAGDAIGVVDPVTGTVTSSGFLGSDPDRLALASDGHTLTVGMDGANALTQLAMPGFGVNTTWNLGGVGTFEGPYYALDVQAAPGAPQTTAVVLAAFDISPSPMGVAIYDNGALRGSALQVLQYPYSSLQWGGNASTLYAADQQQPQDFLVLGVGASGPVLNQHFGLPLGSGFDNIHYDAGTGLVYSDGGEVMQPSSGTGVGSYGASGMVVPDSTLGRVFILGQTAAQSGTANYTIESFDQTHFSAIDSITVENVVGKPTAFVRWGTNGLAFTSMQGLPAFFTDVGPGQLYVLQGSFVNPAQSAAAPARLAQPAPVLRTWGTEPRLNERAARTGVWKAPE